METIAHLETAPLLQDHLVLLHNPAATNGESRSDEKAELLGLDRWTSREEIPTQEDGEATAAAIAEKLRALDLGATPLTTITFVSVGGDGTHHVALQGIRQAELKNARIRLVLADAGNKNDLPTIFGTHGISLVDIVEHGVEASAYPIKFTVQNGEAAPQEYEAFYSGGVGANERVSTAVGAKDFRQRQKTRAKEIRDARFVGSETKLGQKIKEKQAQAAKFFAELGLVRKAIKEIRQQPIILKESSLKQIKRARAISDLIFACAERMAGGVMRFGTSAHNPSEIVAAQTGRHYAKIIGAAAARLAGWGFGDQRLTEGSATFKLSGVRRIQLDAETVDLGEGAEASDTTITAERATPITVVIMQKPTDYQPRHRRSKQVQPKH